MFNTLDQKSDGVSHTLSTQGVQLYISDLGKEKFHFLS